MRLHSAHLVFRYEDDSAHGNGRQLPICDDSGVSIVLSILDMGAKIMGREWYWYVARPDELMVDLDHRAGPPRRALIARARLEGAIRAGKLAVADWWAYRSISPHHYHFMVALCEPMPALLRLFWEQRLCDDSFRSQMNLARLAILGRPWSLLISPEYRHGYHRPPDYVCRCPGKHKGEIMSSCPVSRRLGDACLDANHWGAPAYREGDIILGKQVIP